MPEPLSTATGWLAARAGGPVSGRVVVPGSKSQTNRALLLAGLAQSPSDLDGVLDSRDTELMRAGLAGLGVGFQDLAPGRVRVLPPHELHDASSAIDCGLAGTVMRFLPAAAALAPGSTRFIGDPAASARPVAPVLDALRQLGVGVDADRLPFCLDVPPTLTGRRVTIDSSGSSQFISALLLSGARYPGGLDLRHVGPSIPSAPHIQMTCQMLAERGVHVETPEADHWLIAPGPVAALDATVEPDLTNAAVFLAAAMATGGSVSVPGWPGRTTQPGAEFLDIARLMGAAVDLSDQTVTVTGPPQLNGTDIDLHEASELTPVVAALAVLAEGRTEIRGVAHIRGHETDRLAALEAELSALGAVIRQTPDGLVIEGHGPGSLHGAEVCCHADHRMAHAEALIGLVADGVVLDDITCTSKTMPGFPRMWLGLVDPR